jgi:hypothetical protein
MELKRNSLFATSNLLAYYRLEGNSTDSKGSLNGTDTSITYGTDHGKYGQGASFNGTTSRIVLGTSSVLANLFDGGGTINLWANPAGLGGGNLGRYLSGGVTNSWELFNWSLSGSNLQATFSQIFSTANGTWRSGHVIPLNTWTMITITYNNGATTNNPLLYINGVSSALTKIDTPNGTRNSDTASSRVIGNRADGDRGHNGKIDDVAYFNRILTANEIKSIYEEGGGFFQFL